MQNNTKTMLYTGKLIVCHLLVIAPTENSIVQKLLSQKFSSQLLHFELFMGNNMVKQDVYGELYSKKKFFFFFESIVY
jgi:hypothetical protein